MRTTELKNNIFAISLHQNQMWQLKRILKNQNLPIKLKKIFFEAISDKNPSKVYPEFEGFNQLICKATPVK